MNEIKNIILALILAYWLILITEGKKRDINLIRRIKYYMNIQILIFYTIPPGSKI